MKKAILFKADIDTKGFKSKIESLKQGIDDLTIKQAKLDTTTKDGAAAFVKNDAAIKKLTRESKKYEKVLTELSNGALNSATNNKNLNATLKAEVKSVNQARANNKKLLAIRNDLNLATNAGVKAQKRINSQIQKNNSFIQKNVSGLEKQKINIGNYGTAVGKATGALKRMVGAMAVFQLIKNSFNIVKEFEQSQANLASVLGVNINEMEGLTEQAKRLGATTTFTASQVGELAVEFAKLGFTQEEIEGVTESTLLLAEATGTDLGEAASVVGSTLRGFGLDVSETERVTNVMAKSFTSTSLDMAKFSTGMAAVAPVAKIAGASLEQTTALLGTLTDRGLDASTAGTGLRNMFLKSGKAGLTFEEALKQINESSDKSQAAMELFGVRGATLGVILAETQEDVKSLTEEIDDNDEAARKMAETQRKTLGGAIKLLRSAWEGLILKFEEGTGVFGRVKDVVLFVADNMGMLVKAIGVAGGAWLTYKGIMIGAAVADGVKKTVKWTKALGATIKATTIFQKSATAAQWLWNAAMAANPVGAIVVAVVGLIAAGYGLLKLFGILSSSTYDNAKANEENEASIKANTKAMNEKIDAMKEEHKEMSRNNAQEVALAKAKGESIEKIREMERAQREAMKTKTAEAFAIRENVLAITEENAVRLAALVIKDEESGVSDEMLENRKRQSAAADQRLEDELTRYNLSKKYKESAENDIINSENAYAVADAATKKKNADDAETTRKRNADKEVQEAEALTARLLKESENRFKQAKQLLKDLEAEDLVTKEELAEEIYQAGLTAEERELTALRDVYFEKIELAKQHGLDVTNLELELAGKIQEIRRNTAESDASEKEKANKIVIDDITASFLAKQESDLLNATEAHELRRIVLNKRMEQELEVENLTESQKQEIRGRYDTEHEKNDKTLQSAKVDGAKQAAGALSGLLKSQGKENKQAAIAAASIDAALAISSILGAKTTIPEPFGSIQKAISAAAAGMSAAKTIETIRNTKAEKGISFQGTLQGASHAQGGINLGNGIEAEGGENMYSANGQTHIVNKKASSLINRLGIMGALSVINQREGGGIALNVPTSYASRGGLISSPSNGVEIDYNKLTEAFVAGGSQIQPTVSVTDINNVNGMVSAVEDFATI